MDVVDGNDRWSPVCERPERVQGRNCPSQRIGFGDEPRSIYLDTVEDVEESEAGIRHLILGRAGDEYVVAILFAALETVSPQGGLPDIRFVGDEERDRPVGHGGDERIDLVSLSVAPDQFIGCKGTVHGR